MLRLMLLLMIGLPAFSVSHAEDATLAKGKALVQLNCASCHATGPLGNSPLAAAPTFRDIATRYEDFELEDSLNEGVATDHVIMPDWQMTPEQAHAISTYIISLAAYGTKKSELEPAGQ